MRSVIMLLFLMTVCWMSNGQPVPDKDFIFELQQKKFEHSSGPRILIDEGHNNLHTMNGGLLGLVKILDDDGYRINASTDVIDSEVLGAADIYVIVNALNDSNVGNWVLPTPSAFSKAEISSLVAWVRNGGSLLLVADHMPYGGAVQELAAAFGVDWNNGFAIREGQHWPPSVFEREKGTLKSAGIVTDGERDGEKVDRIASFTGSVFKSPEDAQIFMQFDDSHTIFMPDTAWVFNKNTSQMNSSGWQQGASFEFGDGRVVILGEAAMITAQLVNGQTRVGMNSPRAPENAQLALNIFHYLSQAD